MLNRTSLILFRKCSQAQAKCFEIFAKHEERALQKLESCIVLYHNENPTGTQGPDRVFMAEKERC